MVSRTGTFCLRRIKYIGSVVTMLGLTIYAAAYAQQSASHPDVDLTENERNALAVVARRIDAYDAHDIEAFLLAHAEDVQIVGFPERKIGEGRSHLEWIFGPQFERGLGAIEVLSQSVIDHTVVSHERIRIGEKVERLVAIYTIENDVIASVLLIERDD